MGASLMGGKGAAATLRFPPTARLRLDHRRFAVFRGAAETLSHLEAHEPQPEGLLAGPFDDDLADCLLGVLDERLLGQDRLLVALLNLAFRAPVHPVCRH